MDKKHTAPIRGKAPLLELLDINLSTSEGRPLFKGLNLTIGRERVAIIGRNGVGKSSLLNLVMGYLQPDSGQVKNRTTPYLVPQQTESVDDSFFQVLPTLFSEALIAEEFSAAGLGRRPAIITSSRFSNGEKKKLNLLAAKLRYPDLLMLDEPTEELDEAGGKWLTKWLSAWPNGLLVVSHDRELLSCFEHFFIVMDTSTCESIADAAQVLLMHKFPLALADRPLRSLSPGERVRAAFIGLFQQIPPVQLLVLDEPTYSLDFVGETSLRKALKAWPGALIVASHNREFLTSIDVTKRLVLDGRGVMNNLKCDDSLYSIIDPVPWDINGFRNLRRYEKAGNPAGMRLTAFFMIPCSKLIVLTVLGNKCLCIGDL